MKYKGSTCHSYCCVHCCDCGSWNMFVCRLPCLEHHAALGSQCDDDWPAASLQQLLTSPMCFLHIGYWRTGEQLCLKGWNKAWGDTVYSTFSSKSALFLSLSGRQANQRLGIKIKDRVKPGLGWDTGNCIMEIPCGTSPGPQTAWLSKLHFLPFYKENVCFVSLMNTIITTIYVQGSVISSLFLTC